MIVKNEEQFIKQSLESVNELVDEIIIVDTGSTDNTINIIKSLPFINKIKIFNFEWVNDFSKARNFSIEKATSDWILVLDSDETIAKRDHTYIKQLIEQEKFPAALMVQRHYIKNSDVMKATELNDNDPYNEWKQHNFKAYIPTLLIRLFKNKQGIKFTGVVHESVDKFIVDKQIPIVKTDIPIHHFQYLKDKDSHNKKQDGYLQLLLEKEKQEPNNIKNLHDLAIFYLQKKNDNKKALEYFKKIHDLDKDLLEPFLGIGIVSFKLRDYQKAVKNFQMGLASKSQKTIEISTDITQIKDLLLFNLASCYEHIKETKKAVEAYEFLVENSKMLADRAQKQLDKMNINS